MPQRTRYCCDRLTYLLHQEWCNFLISDGRPCVSAVRPIPISHCPFHGTDLRVNVCPACHQEPCDPECALRFDPDVFAERRPGALLDGRSRAATTKRGFAAKN